MPRLGEKNRRLRYQWAFNCSAGATKGKGRAIDNIFAERLWRSVKYEEVYLHDYETVQEAKDGIKRYFEYYNNERQHQSLGYRTPAEVYFEGMAEQVFLSKSRELSEHDQT